MNKVMSSPISLGGGGGTQLPTRQCIHVHKFTEISLVQGLGGWMNE